MWLGFVASLTPSHLSRSPRLWIDKTNIYDDDKAIPVLVTEAPPVSILLISPLPPFWIIWMTRLSFYINHKAGILTNLEDTFPRSGADNSLLPGCLSEEDRMSRRPYFITRLKMAIFQPLLVGVLVIVYNLLIPSGLVWRGRRWKEMIYDHDKGWDSLSYPHPTRLTGTLLAKDYVPTRIA